MDNVKEYVDSRLDTHELNMDKRFTSLSTHVSNIEAMLKNYASGFPNDDPAGHREYHESVIEKNKAYADLYRKMLFELTKYGLLGFLAWFLFGGGIVHFVEAMRNVK